MTVGKRRELFFVQLDSICRYASGVQQFNKTRWVDDLYRNCGGNRGASGHKDRTIRARCLVGACRMGSISPYDLLSNRSSESVKINLITQHARIVCSDRQSKSRQREQGGG